MRRNVRGYRASGLSQYLRQLGDIRRDPVASHGNVHYLDGTALRDLTMRLRVLVVAAGLLWPASVFSQIGPSSFVSGSDLYEECTNPTDSAKHIHCTGYVTGIADSLNNDGSVCLPANVTIQQIEDVIVSYLREKPRYWQISASALAGTALRTAFRCK